MRMRKLFVFLLLWLIPNCLCAVNYFQVTRDTYIRQSYATTNYGSSGFVGMGNTANDNREGLLEFDTSSVASQCISSLHLLLYPETSTDSTKMKDYEGKIDLLVPGWSHTTITWNTRSTLSVVNSFNGKYTTSPDDSDYNQISIPRNNFLPAFTSYAGTVSLRLIHYPSPASAVFSYSSNYCSYSYCGPILKVESEVCGKNAGCVSGKCTCNSGFSGDGITCSDINDCSPNPCQNGATCTDQGPNAYSCACASGFTGDNCEVNINNCSPNPCQNGATCVDGINTYTCNCVAGYNGKNCETNINDCSPNPCQNGGTCNDLVSDYTCNCPSGYSGDNCEIVTNNCNTAPCQNGGTCVNQIGYYTCNCPAGFNGTNCENNINDCAVPRCNNNGVCIDEVNDFSCNCAGTGFDGPTCDNNINDCLNHLCVNGATCVDQINFYTCSCVTGFSGQFCQTNINECASITCENGGTCIDGINEYECDCTIGYGGDKCEEIILCMNETTQNSQFQTIQAGSTATGSCISGYQGNPTRNCLMPTNTSSIIGIWSSVMNPCIPRFCDESIEVSMIFPSTQAGKNASSLCSDTFSSENNLAIRSCNLDGTWSQIYFPCLPIFCDSILEDNVNWTQTRANSTIFGICESGFAGLPSRYCDQNGNWLSISNPCQAVLYSCEPENYLNSNWGRTAANSIAQSISCDQGYSGNPSRECLDLGIWSSVVNNPCQKLPDPPSNLTLESTTSSSIIISWSHPSIDSNSSSQSQNELLSEPISFDILISTNKINYFVTNNGAGSNFVGTTFEITGLQPFFKYNIRLYAVNSVGQSGEYLEADFSTDLLPPPQLKVISASTFDSVGISWNSVNNAEWYHIMIIEDGTTAKIFASGGFQYSEGLEFNVTQLKSDTSYEIYVHSGRGDSYYEPFGSSLFITTKAPILPTEEPTETPSNSPTESPTNSPTSGPSDSPTAPPTDSPTKDNASGSGNMLPIIIGASVGGFCVIVLIAILLIVFLRRQKREKYEANYELPMDTSITLETFRTLQRGSVSVVSTSDGDATLMNTMLEVSLPGFLLLDYTQQIRREEKIGEGGCAILYRGVLLDLELCKRYNLTDIAVKEIFVSTNLSREDQMERFKQEVAVMWSLNFHPNIIKLVGYCESPLCIITKLYDGDLTALVYNPSVELPLPLVTQLLRDISAGMQAMHSCEIVHRDLKTSNILMESVAKTEGRIHIRAVICDFGIARVATEVKLNNQKFIDVKGMSPRYTAPEVFTRNLIGASVDIEDEKKADIFSFGVIAWELITRQKPWGDSTIEQIELNVRTGSRLPIPEIKGNGSTLIAALIEVCWKQTPSERPGFKEIFSKFDSLS